MKKKIESHKVMRKKMLCVWKNCVVLCHKHIFLQNPFCVGRTLNTVFSFSVIDNTSNNWDDGLVDISGRFLTGILNNSQSIVFKEKEVNKSPKIQFSDKHHLWTTSSNKNLPQGIDTFPFIVFLWKFRIIVRSWSGEKMKRVCQ